MGGVGWGRRREREFDKYMLQLANHILRHTSNSVLVHFYISIECADYIKNSDYYSVENWGFYNKSLGLQIVRKTRGGGGGEAK